MQNKNLLFAQKDNLPAGYQKAKLTIGWGAYKDRDFACGFCEGVGQLVPQNNYFALFVHDNEGNSNHGGLAVTQRDSGTQKASDFYYKGNKYTAGETNIDLLNEWLGLKNQTVEVWIRKGGGGELYLSYRLLLWLTFLDKGG